MCSHELCPVAIPTFPQHAWVELKIPVFGCATSHSPNPCPKFRCAEQAKSRCSVSLKFIDCMSSKKIKKCIWNICSFACFFVLLKTNLNFVSSLTIMDHLFALLCAQPVIFLGRTHRSCLGIAVNIPIQMMLLLSVDSYAFALVAGVNGTNGSHRN